MKEQSDSFNDPTNKQEIADYFRSNIFFAITFYNGWKMLSHSRSSGVVSEAMAKRYAEVQNYHPAFFGTTERALLMSFVVYSLHSFDPRLDSHSLFKLDGSVARAFEEKNAGVLAALRHLRHKLFAHRDSSLTKADTFEVPAAIVLDKFFLDLIELYNQLATPLTGSTTEFTGAYDIKADTERLMMNLYRGEAMRRHEIHIEWDWQQSNRKASDLL